MRRDILFAEDGSVKLPKLTSLALSMVRRQGFVHLSTQPSADHAWLVVGALRARSDTDDIGFKVQSSGRSWRIYGTYLEVEQ